MQKIVSSLWFDTEAIEAAELYTSIFEQSEIDYSLPLHDAPAVDSDSVFLKLHGQNFMFISAGPIFQLNPAISLMVSCSTIEEVNQLWEALSNKGNVLMEIGEYPFSPRYGWVNDRFGVSWQLIYDEQPLEQKIVPSLLYAGSQAGKAKEAIELYVSLFSDSKIGEVYYYDSKENPDHEGMLQYAEFILEGQQFAAMDSAMDYDFSFNEAFSLLVNCDTQEEIDFLWEKLSAVPEAEQCGWLKDRYGVSWQIAPTILEEMLATADEATRNRVTQCFLKMKKMDIAELKKAYEGE